MYKLLALALLAAAGLDAQIVCGSPCTASTYTGSSVVLTSGNSGTWSLSGPGSLSGSNPATSITYNAPTTLAAKNVRQGCSVGPTDSIYNTNIASLPVKANSTAMMTTAYGFSAIGVNYLGAWGTSYADNSTPTVTHYTFYGDTSFPNYPVCKGADCYRESGNYSGVSSFVAIGGGNPDHHIVAVNKDTCHFYETYNDWLFGSKRVSRVYGTYVTTVDSATDYLATSYALTPGTDAAGELLATSTATEAEINGAGIFHVLRTTMCVACFAFNTQVWPAQGTAGGNANCIESGGASYHCVSLGDRMRLIASRFAALNTAACVGKAYAVQCTNLLTQLRDYGLEQVDTGTEGQVQLDTFAMQDPLISAATGAIYNNVPFGPANFEVVDKSSLMVSASSSLTTTPLVKITQTGAPGGSISIAVQPIAIGSKIPFEFPIQAGVSMQIPTWVTPAAASQTVNWVLTSGVGSITAGGVYTAPATLGGGTAAVITGTAAADSAATIVINLKIIASGTLRVDSGSASNTTDGLSNPWIADVLSINGTFTYAETFYKGGNYANQANTVLMAKYTNDLQYKIGVPNGNYKLHLLFSVPNSDFTINGCPPCTTWNVSGVGAYKLTPLLIETQGTVKLWAYDFAALTGYLTQQVAEIYVPAQVTNNVLDLALRSQTGEPNCVSGNCSGINLWQTAAPYNVWNTAITSGDKYKSIDGFEVLPDATSPFWAIDTAGQTTISSGQQMLPFLVEDWYTGANNPTWSIVSGPAGAAIGASSGVLSYTPVGAYYSGQPITVKATNGTYTATATIYTAGGAGYVL